MLTEAYPNDEWSRRIIKWLYRVPDMSDFISDIGKVFDYIKNRFYRVNKVGFVIRGFPISIIELSVPP